MHIVLKQTMTFTHRGHFLLKQSQNLLLVFLQLCSFVAFIELMLTSSADAGLDPHVKLSILGRRG